MLSTSTNLHYVFLFRDKSFKAEELQIIWHDQIQGLICGITLCLRYVFEIRISKSSAVCFAIVVHNRKATVELTN